jgi:hypothetical protein
MSLSKRSIETLMDLVEIKLSCIQVSDRDDARELAALEAARNELRGLADASSHVEIVAFEAARKSSRRARAAH